MDDQNIEGLQSASQEELLSFDDAIKFLDTSKSTLYRLLSLDEIKGVKVGKQWRFRKADLTAYVERSPIATSVDATASGDLDAELSFFASEIAALRPEESEPHVVDSGKSLELRIADLANSILNLAILNKASDVHLEPLKLKIRLRYRFDGVMYIVRYMPISLHEALVARFKEMSQMNLNEKRLPQDGRICFNSYGKEYDIRAGLILAAGGDSLTMRILDGSVAFQGLHQLGLSASNLQKLRASLGRPSGTILATGPAGSGKTRLVYSCLSELSNPDIKVITVEYPVEYQLEEIVQIQVKPRLGLTYPVCMRSALRQDPDVILCGELQDQETAEVVLHAGLMGVLLLTTMLANDAGSVIGRLVDMGVERYLISNSLNAIVSTRQIRKLCPKCKATSGSELTQSLMFSVSELARAGGYEIPDDATFFKPVGCESCRGIGYKGRTGIFEILVCNPKLVSELIRCGSQEEMTVLAVRSGMRTLFADGIRKAVEGETSINEVLRVTDAGL